MLTRPDPTRRNPAKLWPDPTRSDPRVHPTRGQLCIFPVGIIVDPQLKFSNHILEMVKKPNQRAALIHRSFLSKITNNLIFAFKTYVRPLLECASPIWNPSQINLIDTIEDVQKKFTKRLPNVYLVYLVHPIPNDRYFFVCNHLNIAGFNLTYSPASKLSTIKSALILVISSFFLPTTGSRGHPSRLIVPLVKSNMKKYFFRALLFTPGITSHSCTMISNPNPIFFNLQLKKINFDKFLIHLSITLTWYLCIMCVYTIQLSNYTRRFFLCF